MSVQFRCPCGANLRSNESVAGKKITCPKCGTQLQIKPASAEPTPAAKAIPNAPKSTPKLASPLDQFDWESEQNSLPPAPSAPSSKLTYATKKSAPKPIGKWIALGTAAAAMVGGVGLFLLNRKSSISGSFRAAESAVASGSSNVNTGAPTGATASNNLAPSGSARLISGSVGPETTSAKSPALKLAEEFAGHARQGSADRALRMIANEDFEKRLMEGPTASWEAIIKRLETPKVLSHLRSKSLESTPLDEGFRHWRVLGESLHEGQPAVLLRYYSDPEYPRQLISSSNKLLELTQLISKEEFKSKAAELVLYGAKDRNIAAPPSMPDTLGFLPPRFGYMLLILDNSGSQPKIVDIVSVLSQVPMSQMAGAIFLKDWQVIQFGIGSDTEYKKRIDKANSFGRKAFSIYGTVAQTGDFENGSEVIQYPALWFRPLENLGADFKEKSNKTINDWLASHEPSRTTRLIAIANTLDKSSSDTAGLINDFKKQHPGDPGADLAVISFAMTSLETRMPEAHLNAIDQSAESLFKTFNDPFMLYVRGLVQQAKGDQAASDRYMHQANQAGFVAMRMLRKPFEQAVQSGDKEAVLATLKQIGDYWSKNAELDKSTNTEERFSITWTTAKNKADGLNSNLVQRDGVSGGLGRRDPGKNPESSPFGSAAPPGMQAGRSRAGSDPKTPPNDLGGPMRREPGFARPQGPGGQPGPGFPGGFPPPAEPSSANVRFVLESKSSLDAGAILEKLKEKLKVSNFQMSSSGNKATITLGFAGSLEDAVKAVDFGKVTKKDQATRTINIELP